MKMEQTECYETSAYRIQIPRNYPEESIQYPYCSFHAFLHSHQADSGIITQIMPWPLSSTSFSIQHLSLILLFDAA